MRSRRPRATLINLPHLPSADVVGGEDASKTAPSVDADEMANVQHPTADLGRVADHRGLPGVVRPWRRIDRESKGGLEVRG